MRTLIILTLAQAFARCGAPIVVLLGGIVGTAIAPSPSLATLPVALMVVGTAVTTVPAAFFMSRFGRKLGFMGAAAYAGGAGLLAAWALVHSNFWVFCFATFLVGSHNAFIQQYRFAVAEAVPAERVGPAISILMLAGVAAALIGPEVANKMHFALAWGEYTGSFVGMSALMVCAFVCLAFYPDSVLHTERADEPARPLSVIAAQPAFIAAVAAAVTGYAVMSFVMTATPVSMHSVDHFSLGDTTLVIQSHIVGMYLPSLFTGLLVARFGAVNVIVAGLALQFTCLGVAFASGGLLNYWAALVLLGIGWNFLFIGGTTLVTRTYLPSERFKVQALNDFLVFGLQAIAALGSGVVLMNLGWHWVLLLSLPWLALLVPLMLWVRWRAGPANPLRELRASD